MLLLVGLGNPGPEYARNRHNVGFMAVDAIVRRHNLSPPRKRFRGEISEGTMAGEKVLVLKPQTFMNESGRSVGEAVRFYKLDTDDVVVFYDEIDLAPGKLRVKTGGGGAGHNGIRSIDAHLADRNYRRVRIGIGHPGHRDRVHGHVLGNFSTAEQDWLATELDAIAEFAPLLIEGRDNDFMSRVAQTVQPRSDKATDKAEEPHSRDGTASPGAATGAEPVADDSTQQTVLGAALNRALARFRGGTE